MCLATLLDPRFKDNFFVNNITRVSAKDMLELGAGSAKESEGNGSGSVTESRIDSTQMPSPKRQKHDSLLAVVTDILDNSSSRGLSTTTSELNRYLQEPVLDYKLGNPFIWRSENKARFPGLARIAQRYLSATATSVPSERLFSSVGSIYSDHRNRMLAEQAENLLLIKSNYSLF